VKNGIRHTDGDTSEIDLPMELRISAFVGSSDPRRYSTTLTWPVGSKVLGFSRSSASLARQNRGAAVGSEPAGNECVEYNPDLSKPKAPLSYGKDGGLQGTASEVWISSLFRVARRPKMGRPVSCKTGKL